ncbi:MAG: methyltransferase domain-containing protein [Luteimonas sp.]
MTVALLGRVMPKKIFSLLKAQVEKAAYSFVPEYQEQTLPPIFNYWARNYVQPDFEQVGYGSPENLYLSEIRKKAAKYNRPLSLLSLGSGACHLEMGIAAKLVAENIDFKFTCVEFNETLVNLARKKSIDAGLEKFMVFLQLDCNKRFDIPEQDIIIVNQFFHHVTEVEQFCRCIKNSLAEDGLLLTSDLVGRNGHRLWPATDEFVQRYWLSMPVEKRHDIYFGKPSSSYISVDHSAYSSEGVRAQDIVKCLNKEFVFDLFFTFGGSIMPCVERRIGFNFSANDPEDLLFIDEIAKADRINIKNKVYPAVNMIAVLSKNGSAAHGVFMPISPEDHIEITNREILRC